jgi:hypothetical protein
MPRYFFDVHNGPDSSLDEIGTVLRDLEAAREEALATLGGIARDELPDGDRREFVIEVHERGGPVLLRAILSLNVERLSGDSARSIRIVASE